MKKEKPKFYFCYDKKIKSKVVHVLKGDELVSLVSGNIIKLSKEELEGLKPKK